MPKRCVSCNIFDENRNLMYGQVSKIMRELLRISNPPRSIKVWKLTYHKVYFLPRKNHDIDKITKKIMILLI